VIQAFGGNRVTTGGRVTRATTIERPRSFRSISGLALSVGAAFIVVLGVGVGMYFVAARRTAASPPDTSMVVIPAGDYVIGTDGGIANARPRHVEHVQQFRIGRTEVTVGDYERFVKATNAPSPWPAGQAPEPQLPVSRVPWGDAANYCAWKYTQGGRLPSEIEWEAAARGMRGRAYPASDAPEPASANTASAHRSGPAPVGSFPRSATPEGVQDMSGNVWEWTSSPMAAYPGAPSLADSLAQFRVIRGGAFDTSDSVATTWWRGYMKVTSPASALPNTGFRCADRGGAGVSQP
jgi:iron(II)-dependent oxidoreductase